MPSKRFDSSFGQGVVLCATGLISLAGAYLPWWPVDSCLLSSELSRVIALGAHLGAQPLDVLGIGFGPSNVGLAVAVEEQRLTSDAGQGVSARFVEAGWEFDWHGGMLLPGASMQVSYLKDLVTQRSATSPYSFVNYLQERGRLAHFINMKSFFPSRQEFHGYLSWAAARVGGSVPVDYGIRALEIGRANDGVLR